jgi:hypothetical protein
MFAACGPPAPSESDLSARPAPNIPILAGWLSSGSGSGPGSQRVGLVGSLPSVHSNKAQTGPAPHSVGPAAAQVRGDTNELSFVRLGLSGPPGSGHPRSGLIAQSQVRLRTTSAACGACWLPLSIWPVRLSDLIAQSWV